MLLLAPGGSILKRERQSKWCCTSCKSLVISGRFGSLSVPVLGAKANKHNSYSNSSDIHMMKRKHSSINKVLHYSRI